MILGIVLAFFMTPTGLLPALVGEEDEVTGGVLMEEGLLVDGELLVRQLANPLTGGETARRFDVGVLLAEDVDLIGTIKE